MNNETLADIIREMRDLGALDAQCNDMIPRSLQALGLRTYAARLEAARKRERGMAKGLSKKLDGNRAITGNVAAMREALGKVLHHAAFIHSDVTVLTAGQSLVEEVRAALAAPPRNCDVGTAEEQWDRFTKLCGSHLFCSNCPVKALWNFEKGRKPSCGLLWAQMPYEAGGGAE